jgi:hypothetical protein
MTLDEAIAFGREEQNGLPFGGRFFLDKPELMF